MDKEKTKKGKTEGVIDLIEYRKNKNDKRRREYERVLFNRILGVYSFAEKGGLHHVEVVDMSLSGIRFKEETPEKPYRVGDKLSLRFYFTPTSYLKVIVQVKRTAPFDEDGRQGLEYGCMIDKGTKSYEVISKLIAFMELYVEIACQDSNPPVIFF